MSFSVTRSGLIMNYKLRDSQYLDLDHNSDTIVEKHTSQMV